MKDIAEVKSSDSLLSAGNEIVKDVISYVVWPKVLKEDFKTNSSPKCSEEATVEPDVSEIPDVERNDSLLSMGGELAVNAINYMLWPTVHRNNFNDGKINDSRLKSSTNKKKRHNPSLPIHRTQLYGRGGMAHRDRIILSGAGVLPKSGPLTGYLAGLRVPSPFDEHH
eukprot:3085552-Ditylum_brightwellii.AAC.1